MSIFNHYELSRRLGMQVSENHSPKRHRTFIQLLKNLIEWLLESYLKEPEKTVETMKKIKL
jgi:sensor histidine kinase regulating citrate/malate metabolism